MFGIWLVFKYCAQYSAELVPALEFRLNLFVNKLILKDKVFNSLIEKSASNTPQ